MQPTPTSQVPFELAPGAGGLPVSAPGACAPVSTPEQQAAVRDYLTKLGPELRRRHGEQRQLAPSHVLQAINDLGLSTDHACWAYMLFCSPQEFSALHAGTAEACDQDAMRSVVAETFFAGHFDFDVAEVTAAIAEGATESASGWLADVDWSFLFDW